jgi:phage-related protein (TIGR01555 family)
MFKWLKKETPAPVIAEPESADPTASGFFSTEARTPRGKNYAQRHQLAAARSIQVDPTKFHAIDESGHAMDSSSLQAAKIINSGAGYLPIQQFEYYASQGFIGWQQCAIISQNWLVDKACTMPAKDAVRHGYDITVNDGSDVSPKILDAMRRLDKKMKIKKECIQLIKNSRVFGIRHALFLVDGIDYEAPFNPDGVKPGSYRGITQIDPYWLAPMLDASAAGDFSAPDFYEPTWWMVKGRKVHKSHFVILRNGDEVPDILKPSYIYGGISVPQKIFERVYAAERTANEAPMLAMTKRLTVLKLDLTAAMTDPAKFQERMDYWTQLMNNFGVKVIGESDELEQHDTALADMDDLIMTQYQLVAAAANVPATKLLGTTPKGFNATGEYEEASYHEELESIQENELSPFVERHHLLLMRSFIAPKFGIQPVNTEVQWLPVDSPTAKEVAETNKIKAETDNTLVAAGAIDGFDVRQRLIGDRDSGYNGIPDIVDGGPGDREAQQEKEAAEAQANGNEGLDSIEGQLDPTTGMLNGARIITHQRYLDPDKVQEKIAAGDFMVNLTPEFEDEGKKYRMVIDGHHSLAAALTSNVHPDFVESVPRDVVFNPVTGAATDEK